VLSQRSSESPSLHRPLTEKQFRRLLVFANGAMLCSGGNQRDFKPLLDRGLVVGELGAQGCYVNGVTITPEGLRALADGLERYGWRCWKCKGLGELQGPCDEEPVECESCDATGRIDWRQVVE
jgi:hypothetical protein